MKLQEFIKQIADIGLANNGFREEYYRFILFLPNKMLGRGRKESMYVRRLDTGAKPWSNKDFTIPIEHVEGALILSRQDDMAEISFLISLEELRPFAKDLWEALKDYDYNVKVKPNETSVGDKT